MVACKKNSLTEIPSTIKIFHEHGNKTNYKAIDVKDIGNSQILIFGVSNETKQLKSKYDNDGNLYLRLIDYQGNKVDEVSIRVCNADQNQYPLNVIKSGGLYKIFWNYTIETVDGPRCKLKCVSVGVVGDKLKTEVSSEFSIRYPYEEQYFTYADTTLNGSGYTLLGVGSITLDKDQYKYVYLTEIYPDFSFKNSFSQYEITAQYKKNLDVFNIVKDFSASFSIDVINNQYFCSNPLGLIKNGETDPFFRLDPTLSVRFLNFGSWQGDEVALIFTNAYRLYLGKLNATNVYKNASITEIASKVEISGADINTNAIIKEFDNKYYVGGTTLGGQAFLYVYSSLEADPNKYNFGKVYPFELDAFEECDNKNSIVMVGNTLVETKYQKIFIVVMPKNELY